MVIHRMGEKLKQGLVFFKDNIEVCLLRYFVAVSVERAVWIVVRLGLFIYGYTNMTSRNSDITDSQARACDP